MNKAIKLRATSKCMQTKDNTWCVIKKRKLKGLRFKRDLIYPLYLSSPSFCYQQTTQSLIFTRFPDPTITLDCTIMPYWLNIWLSSNTSQAPKYTQHSDCAWVMFGWKLLSMYENGRGKRRHKVDVLNL